MNNYATYQKGNSVRFSVEFFDFNNAPATPALIKFSISDLKGNVIMTTSIGESSKTAVGSYYYDYVFATEGLFYAEWYGEIGGQPSLKRVIVLIQKV